LGYKGVSEYLEDFVARIDVPLVDKLDVTFFHRLIFDTPQFTQFITRTPKLKTYDEARVVFSERNVSVTLPQTFGGMLKMAISCIQSDWQLSSMAQFCSSSFPQALIPAVEHLYVHEDQLSLMRSSWKDDIENSQWLELFHPFTAVKDLYLSRELAPNIARALQEPVGEGVTDVLPALETLFLDETLPSVQEAIGQFVSARKLAGHLIAVSRWERGFDD
jgi:hypothetical protein